MEFFAGKSRFRWGVLYAGATEGEIECCLSLPACAFRTCLPSGGDRQAQTGALGDLCVRNPMSVAAEAAKQEIYENADRHSNQDLGA